MSVCNNEREMYDDLLFLAYSIVSLQMCKNKNYLTVILQNAIVSPDRVLNVLIYGSLRFDVGLIGQLVTRER